MTGMSWPERFAMRASLAKARPVSSLTGSASMSERMRSVGPGPFFSTPTTPVPPNFSVTSKPAARSCAASRAPVFSSWSESSGWACRSRYRDSSEG